MRNQRRRVIGVVAMMVFAVVAMTAAFADTSHTRQSAPSEFIPASPSATPPAKKKADKIVGVCNTAEGCEALKDACKSLKKHSFTAIDSDGSRGVCIDQTQNPATGTFYLKNTNTPKLSDPGFAALLREWYATCALGGSMKNGEPILCCQGVALCTKLKTACKGLQGKYKPGNRSSGRCVH